MISEDEYDDLAARELSWLLDAFDQLEADEVEAELESGILTVEFSDGAKYVINSHRAARQIWMAADRSAWHFDWTGDAWIAQKTSEELWATVSRMVSARIAGVSLTRPAPDA